MGVYVIDNVDGGNVRIQSPNGSEVVVPFGLIESFVENRHESSLAKRVARLERAVIENDDTIPEFEFVQYKDNECREEGYYLVDPAFAGPLDVDLMGVGEKFTPNRGVAGPFRIKGRP